MNLKPQDVLFLLKLVALGKKAWSFNKLAVELGMSSSEVHAAAKRALAARLAVKEGEHIRPHIRNLEEFLLHGIQYVFVPERGELNRGMPTAYASAPLDSLFVADEEKQNIMKGNGDKLFIGDSIVVSQAALQDVAKRFHIKRLVLFGSAARGELTPQSDIDLLVEFEKGKEPSLGGMVDIQNAFVKLFGGRKVDVVTPSILNNPYRKRAIEKDMEELYAA